MQPTIHPNAGPLSPAIHQTVVLPESDNCSTIILQLISEMATRTAKAEIFLKTPDNWDTYNKQFQSRAVALMFWDLINPKDKDDNQFEPKPEQLNVKNYEK